MTPSPLPAGWFPLDVLPLPGTKIVALFSDGSGARMLYLCDGATLDTDGCEDEPWPMKGFGLWSYLPQDFEFHCEAYGDEAMPLRAATSPGDVSPGPTSVGP